MRRHIDFSPRGRVRVVLWTVLGTLGCIVAAMVIDSSTFGTASPAERLRSLLLDVGSPILIGAPLFYYFSSKLRELAIAHHKLALLASTDSLTDVLNRGAFTTLVDAYLAEVRATQASGALLVIDVDHFKRINDSLGHDRGDEALRLIAATIRSVVRSVDLVGRMGGEEFGVFLPGASPGRAQSAAERIRQAIFDADFHPDGERRQLSVSVGGAVFDRQVPFSELYRAADQRLYAAKEAGRNRVLFSAVGSSEPQAVAA